MTASELVGRSAREQRADLTSEILNLPRLVCGIYHLRRDGAVVYIGSTTNVLSRLGQHVAGGHEFDDVEFFPCDADLLNDIEHQHIKAYRPRLNKAGVTRRFFPRPPAARGQWFSCPARQCQWKGGAQ